MAHAHDTPSLRSASSRLPSLCSEDSNSHVRKDKYKKYRMTDPFKLGKEQSKIIYRAHIYPKGTSIKHIKHFLLVHSDYPELFTTPSTDSNLIIVKYISNHGGGPFSPKVLLLSQDKIVYDVITLRPVAEINSDDDIEFDEDDFGNEF